MASPSKTKEQSRLLDLSSDEESEDLQLEIIPNRKRKITRKSYGKDRRNPQSKSSEPSIASEVQCALCWAVRGTVLLWLLMLTWICASLYDQVTTMKLDIGSVSSSSASVSDSLQICHTAAKELKANATELTTRLSKLEKDHQELALRMEQATKELAFVSDQLSAAPKLADTPRRLAELQRTVADFGSQIKGFDSALASAKKQAVTASSGVEEVRNILHELEGRNNDTIANITNTIKTEEELKNQLTVLNNTLFNRIYDIENKVREINKPSSTVASITTQPVANVTKITNTTETQGPAKPFVLH
ncbi:uncharacterized protein LOC116772191 isoform X1 [Danaus plexippus]|uniref:uncharacterized protein LOC116772191 isoform X1 n=1 Tax=Danaus plexippus TaxID=13037 RepID=UPI002AAFC713|nr:uncharacterized protein LOC116772191 isoform X1 [Danaus plexippus]